MINEIIVFVQLAELKSFHKTAKKLNLSPATVTRRIAALENNLKIKLIKRNTRTLSLTQDGWHCYERWQQIPEMILEVKKGIGQARKQIQGEINLGVSVYSGFRDLIPVISEFLRQFPKIKVNFVKSNIHPDIIDDSYDIFFRHQEINTRIFQSKSLNSYELITVASPHYLKANKRPQNPSDLLGHNCIIHRINAHEGGIWQYRDKGKNVKIKISGNLSLNNAALVVEAVLAGVGIARLPRYLVSDYLSSGELVEVMKQYVPAPLTCYLVYPRKDYMTDKIQVFVDFILNAYGKKKNI